MYNSSRKTKGRLQNTQLSGHIQNICYNPKLLQKAKFRQRGSAQFSTFGDRKLKVSKLKTCANCITYILSKPKTKLGVTRLGFRCALRNNGM